MTGGVDRRTALALGGAAMAAGLAPAGAARPPEGLLLFDPQSGEASHRARRERGQRLVALEGDPVRLWRDHVANHEGPVGGLTRWSDFVVLSGLAAEAGRRIVHQEEIRPAGEPLLVSWTAA